jgi:integrase
MVKTCLYTGGQRLGDVATLRWSQVDEKRGVIRMTTQKKGKPLMIPIFPALKKHLQQRRKEAPGEFLHPECADIFESKGSVKYLWAHPVSVRPYHQRPFSRGEEIQKARRERHGNPAPRQ